MKIFFIVVQKKHLICLFVSIIMLFLSCNPNYKTELGNGYYLDTYEGKDYACICDSTRTILIDMCVLDYAYDSIFIIATQKPYVEIYDSLYNANPKLRYEETKRIFKESLKYYYWIINKKQESIYYYDTVTQKSYRENVYGQYNREEYLKKREELGVPDNLRLAKYD